MSVVSSFTWHWIGQWIIWHRILFPDWMMKLPNVWLWFCWWNSHQGNLLLSKIHRSIHWRFRVSNSSEFSKMMIIFNWILWFQWLPTRLLVDWLIIVVDDDRCWIVWWRRVRSSCDLKFRYCILISLVDISQNSGYS